jgi:hypothetical protein
MQLTLPVSVIIAGVMLSAAVVFTRPGPAPVVSPEPVVTPAAPPVAVVAPVVTPEAVLTPEIQARGRENARQALERLRPEFVANCWQPSAAVNPEPRRIKVAFSLGFTPQGTAQGVGIVEDHAAYRNDMADCLRTLAVKAAIPAPGVPLSVEVPFELP